MGETKRVSRFSRGTGRVLKHVAVDDGNEQFFVIAGGAPAYRRSKKIGQVTDSERLGMAAIAPIGVEIAERAMLATGFSAHDED